jgi:hypothetical protein
MVARPKMPQVVRMLRCQYDAPVLLLVRVRIHYVWRQTLVSGFARAIHMQSMRLLYVIHLRKS